MFYPYSKVGLKKSHLQPNEIEASVPVRKGHTALRLEHVSHTDDNPPVSAIRAPLI